MNVADVRYERHERIGHIVLDRPAKLNALTDGGIINLREALEAFDDDDEAWVGIISGEGRAFCSGADVRQRQARPPEEIARLGGLQPRNANLREVFNTQIRMKPIIAAVHGMVLGAAVRIALHSDLLVASEGTIFQVTEVARGVDAVGFWILISDRVGTTFADDVCITGRRWLADEPAAQRLLTCLASPGEHLKVAEELASKILQNPPLAVRNIVRARRARIERLEHEGKIQADRSLLFTEDFRESVQAFLEKRPPVYKGK